MSGLFHGTPLQQPVTCERCGLTLAACACPRDRASGKVLDPRTQPVRVRCEKRNGKTVTVAAGFSPRSARTDDLPAMLRHLRSTLGSGGAANDAGFELQGDHRDKVIAYLTGLGYPAKAAGG